MSQQVWHALDFLNILYILYHPAQKVISNVYALLFFLNVL
jgi:hypothetical protein